MRQWIIAEWFEPQTDPTVIAVGHTAKDFVPLDRILSSRLMLREARAAIGKVGVTFEPVERISGRRRTIVVPLLLPPLRLHGVMLWSGWADEPVPARSPAGAWCFDMRSSTNIRSDDMLTTLGIPRERWDTVRRHSVADVFGGPFIVNHQELSTLLRRLVHAVHGTNTQTMWAAVHESTGRLRAQQHSCRQLDEPDHEGRIRHLVRGISYDVGPAAEVPAAPPPTTFAHQVLEASASTGRYSAILHPRTLHLLQWQGAPMPQIAWQAYNGQPLPAIHPDDLPVARAMAASLDRGEAGGVIRVRALDGTWIPVSVHASALRLHSTAAAILVTVRFADTT